MKVAVIGGAGHAGLPLAVFLAQKGHQVFAVDSDPRRLELVRAGSSPFFERGLDEMLQSVLAAGMLVATQEYSVLAGVDIVFIVVGTDLNDHQQPQNDSVFGVVRQLSKYVSPQCSVVLRSTVMPGTTGAVAAALGGSVSEVAFCPERIAEGRALEELGSIPQLVGTVDGEVSEVLRDLFRSMGVEIIQMRWQEAELSKLILNSWRYAQFAFANEIARLCESHDVSFSRIRNLLLDQYPRGQGMMAPGFAGGPCLRKDTVQLLVGTGSDSRLFQEVINSHDLVVERVAGAVLDELTSSNSTVVQLGMTFKPGSDDLRGSVALDLARILSGRLENFFVVDPHITESHEFRMLSLDEVRHIADVVVVGTLHPQFFGLSLEVPVIDLGGPRLVNRRGMSL